MPNLDGATQRAATVIVTVDGPEGVLIALAAVDPRWRLDRKGLSDGIPALKDGTLTPLPVSGLKFIGGLVDEGEDAEESALRELAEEAGPRIAELVRRRGMREVYCMLRVLEWSEKAKVGITYLHAAIDAGEDGLEGLFEPGDDCLAILLFRPGQIALEEAGYFVSGPPVAAYWREAYVPIPYGDWLASDAQASAYEAYNAAGAVDPTAGLDMDIPEDLHVSLFCPKDATPTDVMGEGDPQACRPLPDGAILAHLLKGEPFAVRP